LTSDLNASPIAVRRFNFNPKGTAVFGQNQRVD